MVALIIIGLGKLSDVIFYVEKPKTPGYVVEVEQVAANTTQSTAETTEIKTDISALMALGDLATGEKVFKNVQHAIQLIRVEKIILVRHYTM